MEIKKNVIQGQRPNMENRNTQQRIYNKKNTTYKVSKVNKQIGLH